MKLNRCTYLLASALAFPALRAETIVTYPPGTVLENIAIAPGGDLFVSDLFVGTLFRVTPGGLSEVYGAVPGQLAGVAMDLDGRVVAAGGNAVYKFASDGSAAQTDVAGAGFLNGLTVFRPGVFLMADDTANLIWQVNLNTGTSSPWLMNDLLVPPDGSLLPIGLNGIKIFNGAVYISNTGASTIVRIPILGDGTAGAPKVYASSLQADDFAFGADGSLFAATQLGEIIRLYPDGTRTLLLTGTLGDASVAFGRTAGDLMDLYVVNNGGAFLDLPGGPLEASIVRLATDTTGVAPESQVVPEPSSLALVSAAFVATILFRRRPC